MNSLVNRETVLRRLEEIREEAGVNRCLECGKCTASCPMAEIYASFGYEMSPRGIVESARTDDSLLQAASIWHCLECDSCTKGCVASINYKRMMKELRQLASACCFAPQGVACRKCRRVFFPSQAIDYIVRKVKGFAGAVELFFTCPSCRPRLFGAKTRWKGKVSI